MSKNTIYRAGTAVVSTITSLKYNDDNYTSNCLDMLLDLGFMPLITKLPG